MSISLLLDEDKRVWRLSVGESFDLSDVSELSKRTDWHGVKSFLWDLRDLRQGPGSSRELHQAVALTEEELEFWIGSRVAILVARDLDFGIARMFTSLADEINVVYRAFRDEAAALEWLASSSSE
jgi:hypothetical protein